jgi:hypothetical protein
LQDEFRIACTPRVRRGIDIDAGCGQLTTRVLEKENADKAKVDEFDQSAPGFSIGQVVPQVGVYEGDYDDEDDEEEDADLNDVFAVDPNAVDLESADDYEDPEFSTDSEMQEAARLIALVQQGTIAANTPPIIKQQSDETKS